MKANTQNAERIFLVIVALSALLAAAAMCVLPGCGPIHIHLGERHYCGSTTSQPAIIGASNPTLIMEAD